MKISIITIVLNDEKNIEKTILSIINQTYKNFEYIIIDGGSMDKTLEIINKYSNSIDTFISEKDNGISDAFNKATIKSKGEYLLYINSGDQLHDNDVLQKINKSIQNDQTVYFGSCIVTKDGQYLKKLINKNAFSKLKIRMTLAHQSIIYPKDYFDQFGLYSTDYKIAMDYEHILRGIQKYNYKYIPIVISIMNLEGISNKHFRWHTNLEIFKIKEKLNINNTLINIFWFLFYSIRPFFDIITKKIPFLRSRISKIELGY